MKIVIILLSIFILTGCNNENAKDKEYYSYVNILKESTEFESELPFDISIYLKKLNNDEVTYKVIIDNPKKELKYIEAIIQPAEGNLHLSVKWFGSPWTYNEIIK